MLKIKVFLSKYPYFKKARVAIFADIIKIVTMFIKLIIKDPRKVKRNRNYVSVMQNPIYICIS